MDNTTLVQFINSTGFITVNCLTTYDPKRVEIDFPLGISLSLPYDQYQQIRHEAGLPEDVCQ